MICGAPPSADIGLRALGTLTKQQSVAMCMACHALKTRLVVDWRSGADLSQFYSAPSSPQRLGFQAGEIAVPKDFNGMGQDAIEALFGLSR